MEKIQSSISSISSISSHPRKPTQKHNLCYTRQIFKPISSYGFIGNLRSCALVNIDGAIDWCCLPSLDSPSVFGALLDPEVGGSFRIAPLDENATSTQTYAGETNILRTEWKTETGTIEVLDWMHMGAFTHEENGEFNVPAVYRLVRCISGAVDVHIHFNPRLDYARAETTLEESPAGVIASSKDDHICLHGEATWVLDADGASTNIHLKNGTSWACIVHYGGCGGLELADANASLALTHAYWERWIHECEDGECPTIGPWQKHTIRSLLALKILSGGHGIAAAATTSLPECISGDQNWDYRFSWIRDTAFTVQSLTQMGHFYDAQKFLKWISEILHDGSLRPADLQPLYPIHVLHHTEEEELSHLRGYRDSRPVRIGNAAEEQKQWDMYGEILDAVYRSEKLQPGIGDKLSSTLSDIVDYVCDIWHEPDNGIWELRRGREHYVYSKVMCWVALDRGIKIAEKQQWNANIERWKKEREAIRDAVMDRGYNTDRGCFCQSFESDVVDATALLFPLLEFIDPAHPYAVSTLEVIQKELVRSDLVFRSEEHRGKEGAFMFCSFWLVDALTIAGKFAEAEQLFQSLLKRANHVGLYAEEIDPDTGEFLGNFPQAFTHVGLINSAIYLGRSTTTEPSEHPLIGEKHMPDEH